MAAAGGKEALFCVRLLCCWNFALLATPFNSRPAVFIWVNEQGPDKLVHAPLLSPVDFVLSYPTVDHVANTCP